jgi:hypothetical protein
MDLDLEKAVEANGCYRDEDGNLFLMVTASDVNNGTSSADPRPSYSIETVISDDTVAEDNNVTSRIRKRPTTEKWKQNKRKENRNKYEEYINTKGVAVLAKMFKVPTCRDRCYLALPNIEGIFEKYKNLGSYDKQNLYLQGRITVTVERRQRDQ